MGNAGAAGLVRSLLLARCTVTSMSHCCIPELGQALRPLSKPAMLQQRIKRARASWADRPLSPAEQELATAAFCEQPPHPRALTNLVARDIHRTVL